MSEKESLHFGDESSELSEIGRGKIVEAHSDIEEKDESIKSVVNSSEDTEKMELIRKELDREIIEKTHEKSEKTTSGELDFDINGTVINVKWHRYLPRILTKENEIKEDVGLIFLPGWSSTPESKSTLPLVHGFAQQVTKDSGSFVLSIDTRAKDIIKDSLYYEAEAIRKFIESEGLSEIVLAGHSQGGDEAINLAALLEERNPEIKVRGLILLDAVGIYKQGKFELMQKFIRDVFRSLVLTRFSKRIRQAEADIMVGIGREMSRSKLMYLKRLENEIADMANKNPRAEKVRCPIVLVQGEDDLISSPEKTIELAKGNISLASGDQTKLDPRENLLRGIFPNSSHIRWMQAKNEGNHFVPLQRGETAAAASLYLLRRQGREENKKLERSAD